MFYGLAKGLIDSRGFQFEHILQDIQTLNERAERGELDISAISIHTYPYVCSNYALLPSGASMGDGYGPMVIGHQKFSREELLTKRIAVPGLRTSAFLALQLWLGVPAAKLDYTVVPFDQIFSAVQNGEAAAGLIIHEGQLTFEAENLVCSVDLGKWWKETRNGLPLPLGGNVIHKRIPPQTRREISSLLTESIRYSLNNRQKAVEYALQFGRGLNSQLADKFVGMYVNDWTLDYGPKGREAITLFLGEAFNAGLLRSKPELEFVE